MGLLRSKPELQHAVSMVQSPGLVLDGGSDSMYGVLFVKDILAGSPAADECSLRPLDLIHYINGAPTQDLTLSESTRLLELSLNNLTLKATRSVHQHRLTWVTSALLMYRFFFLMFLLWLTGTGSRFLLDRKASPFSTTITTSAPTCHPA